MLVLTRTWKRAAVLVAIGATACADLPTESPDASVPNAVVPAHLPAGSGGGLPLVTVRADAPPQAEGSVTNSLWQALERVRAGGTIRIHPGTYFVEALPITKPVTIEGTGAEKPVILAETAFSSFHIGEVEPEGTVRIRGLEFRNPNYGNIFVGGRYDDVVIENSHFFAGSGPKTNGPLGYSTAVLVGISSGNSVLVQNNTFTGGDIGVLVHDATGVIVRGNHFTNQDNAAIHGGALHAEGNTIDGCGVFWCIFGGEALTLLRNRIDVDADRPVTNAIQLHGGTHRVEENAITGTGGARDVNDPQSWPITSNAIAFGGAGVVSGNRVRGAHNGLGFGDATVSGSDNVVSDVGTVLNIYRSTVTLHRSDFTGYSRALQFVYEQGASTITCNWWGSPAGPQNADGFDPSLYTPWAAEPIAGREDVGCG